MNLPDNRLRGIYPERLRTIKRSWQSLVNFSTPQIISGHRGNAMKNQSKTKQALIQELALLRQRIENFEKEELRHQKNEKALQESKEKYRELVENTNNIIIKMDRKGKINFFNDYAQKFFGYQLDEILGKEVKILLPPIESNGRNLEVMMNEILRNPDGFVENINENILKNGTHVWISWRNKAVKDSRGHVVGNLAVGRDITRLIRSEMSLRESELRFRSLFENSLDGIMITVADGSILSANEKMCGLLSMTEEEITYAGREGIVVKDERLAAALEQRARTGKFHGELTFRRKDGSLVPTELSSITFKDLDGNIKTGQVVRDITERKLTEKALMHAYSELELRVEQRTAEIKRQAELLNLTHDAVIVRDEEGRIAFWSTGAEEMYGWTKNEAVGKVAHNLLHTKFPIPFQDIMAKAKGEGRWEGELIHDCKDGSQIVVLSRWALRRNETSGHAEIMEINGNITVRKASEEALRIANAYNRSLIEANLDPLVTIGADGQLTDVNVATEKVTGHPRTELIGTDFSQYFSDVKKAKAGYRLVFKDGFVRDYELAIRQTDGHITPVIYNASVYRNESGQVAGVFAAARDISKLKLAEKEILDKSKALEELNTALKVLIDHYKNDQREFEEAIVSNIKVRIIPYLDRLKQTRLDIGQSALLEIIERSFRDISSPFLRLISSEHFRFTPKEIEIISLIKEGKTTKEIGQFLRIGKRTVDSYRDNIRSKLGLAKKKLNLRTYLLSLPNTSYSPVIYPY
jgi:PAS domain S-box-containing protein